MPVENPKSKKDDTAFTIGSDGVMPMGALADDTSPDSVDEGDIGIPRMTLTRILRVAPTDAGGGNLGKAEDVAHVSGDYGIMALVVRKDTAAALATTDGDYAPLEVDANGYLHVKAGANSGVDIGDVDVTSVIPGTGATNLGKAIDAVAGATDTGLAPLAVRDDALGGLTPIEGDYVALRTDANGALWTHDDALDAALSGSELQVDVVAALPAGDNNIGNVDIVTLPAGNLGQQAKAASLSTAPATDITDATYIGDIKFGEALPAGTNLLGKVGIDQATANANEVVIKSGTVTAVTAISNALPAGTNIIGKVGIDQTTSGTTNGVSLAAGAGGHVDARGNTTTWVQGGTGVDEVCIHARPELFNGATWDKPRSIASSGAGLGVQQVGTLGELITLAASAARTESANGTAVTGLGWRNRYIVLFDLTVADTDAGDTLDVYVDVSLDGSTWLNAIHFTQIVGTDAASKRYAVLDPAAPGTSEILVTADAAAGAVRPSMFGPQMRARWAIVDAGTDDASFTFSVTAFAL